MSKIITVSRVQDKPMKNGGTFHILTIDGAEYASFDKGWVNGAMYEVEFVTRGDRTNVKKIKEIAPSQSTGPTLAQDVKKNIYDYEIPKYPAFAMRYAVDLTQTMITSNVLVNPDHIKDAIGDFFRFIMDKFEFVTTPTDDDGFLIEEDSK